MNKKDYKVSIVVNCRNGEKYLAKSLDSIFNQNFKNFEVIFFNNLSDDNSLKIASKYDERLKIINSSKILSLGEARLNALKEISGDLFCFLDVDDIMLPNRISIQSGKLMKSHCIWSFGSYRKIDENGKVIKKISLKLDDANIFDSLLSRYTVNFQSTMFKKEVIKMINPFFDPALSFSPDFNLIMKISLDHDPLIIKEPLIDYRIHKESLTSKSSHHIADEFRTTIEELKKLVGLNSAHEISLNRALKKYHWYKALQHVKNGEIKKAKSELLLTNFLRYEYLFFFLVLWLPARQKIFLKLNDIFKN
jgi:teichuronic acid biosynthesis glycosyltransferase TuaG|tara:strand:- start:13560 stop:14480 length:921 start_codon:yes stop_codon:yes gene_type:complete